MRPHARHLPRRLGLVLVGLLSSSPIRLLHYVGSVAFEVWRVAVADDFRCEVTGQRVSRGPSSPCGPPPCRASRSCGRRLWAARTSLVGYHIRLRERELGISASRTEWLVQRMESLVRNTVADMQAFSEGLGRAWLVFGALDFERPFLGPLYAFAALHPCDAIRPHPYVCPPHARLPRGAAPGGGTCTRAWSRGQCPHAGTAGRHPRRKGDLGVGRWLLRPRPDGAINAQHLPWFAVRLTRTLAP